MELEGLKERASTATSLPSRPRLPSRLAFAHVQFGSVGKTPYRSTRLCLRFLCGRNGATAAAAATGPFLPSFLPFPLQLQSRWLNCNFPACLPCLPHPSDDALFHHAASLKVESGK